MSTPQNAEGNSTHSNITCKQVNSSLQVTVILFNSPKTTVANNSYIAHY